MLQRRIKPLLLDVLKEGKSVLLLGPRQTGKTTMLKPIPHTLYLSFAKVRTRLEYEKDPARLEREAAALRQERSKQKPLFILDEIQKVPALMDQVQDLIDEGMAQFILTGSSARKLRKAGHPNLLPGRVVSLRLDPLCLGELPSRPLEEHLLFGDLPEIALMEDSRIRTALLRSYVEAYLDEEVKAEALVRALGPFARFLELAAIDSGRISNYSAISKEIGPSVHTIASYYEVLVDCLIAERIEPITRSTTRKKLIRSPKYLFFDSGVRRIAAHEGTKLIPERMGELFEQWVGLEILRKLRSRMSSARLCFWRDPDGPEVDWVIDRDGRYTPIEVKWTDSPRSTDAKHIETFLAEYPNCTPGFVVCRAPRPQRLSAHVTAIPWQELDGRVSDGL